jgi:hypothetical protein
MSDEPIIRLNRLARAMSLFMTSVTVTGLACAIESESWRFCYIVAAVIFLFAAWAHYFAPEP